MLNKLESDNVLIDKLWNECGQSIKKLCEIKLRSDPEAAKDVYSDVFLSLTKAVKEGRAISNHKAWLYKTANNLIIKKYEDIKKNKEVLTDFSDEATVNLAITTDVLDATISDDDIERMADVIIGELNREEQCLLENYYYNNKTLKEIAVLTGKSECAIKQRHYRLCKRIRHRINEEIEKY